MSLLAELDGDQGRREGEYPVTPIAVTVRPDEATRTANPDSDALSNRGGGAAGRRWMRETSPAGIV